MPSRTTILLVSTIFLQITSNVFAQCGKDTDCKGDRICVNGACVNPGQSSSENNLQKELSDDTIPAASATAEIPVQQPVADTSEGIAPANLRQENSKCGTDSFYIDFQCMDVRTVTTAGSALFALTEAFYTPLMLTGGISSIVGGILGSGDEEIRYGALLPQVVVCNFLSFANMAPLAKQRRYLNQIGVDEGKKMYSASWITSSLTMGTTGLMFISWAATESGDKGIGFPTTVGVVNVAAITSTWVIHLITYLQQKQLLLSTARSNASNRSNSNKIIVQPYFSASLRGDAVTGLVFSW